MKTIRTATICHNEDDHKDKKHRRAKLILRKTKDGYVWKSDDSEDIGLPVRKNIFEACEDVRSAYRAECWALKENWK